MPAPQELTVSLNPLAVIRERLANRRRQLAAAREQMHVLAGAVTELELVERQLTASPPAAEPADTQAP